MVSEQWFVRTEGMARRAREAVATGEMKILPERFEKTWFNWLDNIHDWCISRQLWWGHRIPVFYVQRDGKEDGTYVVARDLAEAQRQVEQSESAGAVITLRQEEDVLDTWFRYSRPCRLAYSTPCGRVEPHCSAENSAGHVVR